MHHATNLIFTSVVGYTIKLHCNLADWTTAIFWIGQQDETRQREENNALLPQKLKETVLLIKSRSPVDKKCLKSRKDDVVMSLSVQLAEFLPKRGDPNRKKEENGNKAGGERDSADWPHDWHWQTFLTFHHLGWKRWWSPSFWISEPYGFWGSVSFTHRPTLGSSFLSSDWYCKLSTLFHAFLFLNLSLVFLSGMIFQKHKVKRTRNG